MIVAQTHLQLLRQARDAGYNKSEILDLRRDYETALRLHGHQARYSGRPFVCHLVGTASVAMAEGKSLLAVRAALNHAAFDVGRFLSGTRGVRADHVRWLQSRVGDEVLALVLAINDAQFLAGRLPEQAKSFLADLSGHQRLILEHEIFNEVDDGVDYGAALEVLPKWHLDGYIDGVIDIARQLDLQKCAAAIEVIKAELPDSEWLTPDKHFTFTGHQPSPPRYLKGRVVAVLKKLKGETEHF